MQRHSVAITAILTIGLLGLADTPAEARRSRDTASAACFGKATDDDTISGCTAYLARSGISAANRVGAHFNRAIAYDRKGDRDSAIADYDEVIRINPNQVGAYNNRGTLRQNKKDYDGAIRDFTEAIRRDPKYVFAPNNRGIAYTNTGDYEAAIRDFDHALRLDPGYTVVYYNRGEVYEKKGDLDRARADYTATLALPQKYSNGQWAHDAARKALARLDSPSPTAAKQFRDSGRLQSDTAVPLAPAQPVEAARPASSQATPVAVAAPSPLAVAPAVGKRVALVMGNAGYKATSELPNARADAGAMAAALREVGFTKVTLATDLTRETMMNALRGFAAEAESADWATVYYAGHGIEMNGINYLIPVDAKLATDRDMEFEAVPLERLLGAVEGARKLRLVMLDACRDNPFVQQMRRSVSTRSIGRGLAQIEPEAGTLVVFAAKHGQVAYDGETGNSPFVSSLLQRIKTPGLEVRRLFDVVRDDVMTTTRRRQQPFSYGSVSGSEDFFFVTR